MLETPVDQIGLERTRVDLGGLDKRIVAYRLPDRNECRSVELTANDFVSSQASTTRFMFGLRRKMAIAPGRVRSIWFPIRGDRVRLTETFYV